MYIIPKPKEMTLKEEKIKARAFECRSRRNYAKGN